MSFTKINLLRLIPMACVMGIIFFLSHQPGESLYLPPYPGIDKIAHMAVYGVLASTVLYIFSPATRAEYPLRLVGLTVLICLGYGLSDEFHQSYIVNRSPSGFDVLADCAGAVLVCALWLLIRKGRKVILAG